MMYIDDEFCKNLEQLKSYFNDCLSNNNVYEELLDSARGGRLSPFLRDLGEEQLADTVDSIDGDLCDSDYMSQLITIITGDEHAIEKIPYEQCFMVSKLVYERLKSDIVIKIEIKIIEYVNEDYRLTISCNYGEETFNINTFEHDNKTIITKEYKYPIRNEAVYGNLMIDGKYVMRIKKNIPEIFVDGHSINAVDLGLSVLWADRNIGASSPHEIGKYVTYNEIPLSFEGSWRLPTKEECEELQQRLRQTGNYITDGHRTIPVKEKIITGRNGVNMIIPRSGYYVNSQRNTIQDEEFGYFWSNTSEIKGTRYCLRSDGTLFKHYDEKYLLPVRLVCTKFQQNSLQNDYITEDSEPAVDTKDSLNTVVSGVQKHIMEMLRQELEDAYKKINEAKKN